VQGLGDRLTALNPFAVLKRGYTLVTNEQGALVVSVDQVQEKQHLHIRFSDGSVKSQVTEVTGGK
jgi:exodeoxyribonuclease VII large subunit